MDRSARKSGLSFWLILASIWAVGLGLRFYLLANQILLDDEWHGLVLASRKSFGEILGLSSFGATSPLSNLYYWALLHTVGWSAVLIRLPQIVAGAAALIVFPLHALRIFGRGTALLFAGLLSISPFLVFYSRNSRPYSTMLFFGFLALLHLHRWTSTGRQRSARVFLLSGFLAVCFHPISAVLLGGALVAVMAAKRFRPALVTPQFAPLLAAGAALAALTTVFYLLLFSKNPWLGAVVATPALPPWGRLFTATMLFSGTHRPVLIFLFFSLVLLGARRIAASEPLLAIVLIPGSLVATALVLTLSGQPAIAMVRYLIVVLAVFLLCAAVALAGLADWGRQLGKAASRGRVAAIAVLGGIAVFLALLWQNGPLVRYYANTPNNFLNHSRYFESFRPRQWEKHSYVSAFHKEYGILKEEIPEYYLSLAENPDVDAILEYPMLVGDSVNLYYYYQRFHQKRVFIGYTTSQMLPSDLRKDFAFEVDPIDTILSLPDPQKLIFRNMIALLDFRSVLESGADRIVFHRNLLKEMRPRAGNLQQFAFAPPTGLIGSYESILGPPEYVDDDIIVFAMNKEAMRRAMARQAVPGGF